jgi:uncharacterized protein
VPEEINYSVAGVTVRADLYLPEGVAPGERRPALVGGNGFSSVKAGLQIQGEFFSKAGYAFLAIDYRSFGRSDGEIRGELFPERQVEDFRGGISYLETHPAVDPGRIGIWGASFGGAIALSTAARDRRARVAIVQSPIVNGHAWMSWLRNPQQWEQLRDALDEDRRRRFAGEPSKRIPVCRDFLSNEICAMPTDAQGLGFLDELERTVPSWRPDITLESIERVIEFNPSATIHQISPRPLCIIMNGGYDVIHPLDRVLEAYCDAAEPKKLALLPYDQLGLYVDPGATASLETALGFLREHMPLEY